MWIPISTTHSETYTHYIKKSNAYRTREHDVQWNIVLPCPLNGNTCQLSPSSVWISINIPVTLHTSWSTIHHLAYRRGWVVEFVKIRNNKPQPILATPATPATPLPSFTLSTQTPAWHGGIFKLKMSSPPLLSTGGAIGISSWYPPPPYLFSEIFVCWIDR